MRWSTPVAEFTIALVLNALRHAVSADRDVRAGRWMRPGLDGRDTRELTGKTVGIVAVDPTSPFLTLGWGTVPSRTLLTLPSALPTPQPLVFQVVAFNSSFAAGNVSNAVPLTIQ